MTFIFTFIFGGALFLRFSGEKNNTFELGKGLASKSPKYRKFLRHTFLGIAILIKPLLILGILYPLALVWP